MLDRKTPPPFVQSTSFDLIHPVKINLQNGTSVYFISGGSQDVIKIELLFPAGTWAEKIGGASYFTGNLLTKGTRKKTSYEIAQGFDLLGASIEINPALDLVSVAIFSLTKHVTPILKLLNEIINEPTFPEKELDQFKAIYLQNLKINKEKTSFLATRAFRKNIFGESHPYGKELDEKEATTIQQAHLTEHFNNFYRNATIFISGKIDRTVENLVVEAFQNRKPSNTLPAEAITPDDVRPFYQYIEKKGSIQASIRSGRKSVLRNHSDYVPTVFVSHILGGYFGSRLMKNIREEKGLTYGIYASLNALQRESYIVIGSDVNQENIQLTLDEIRKELKRLRTEKISSEELVTAKNHFIGSLQSEITTPFAHADKIKTIHLFNLPDNYYQQMINTIDTITPDKIIETAEKYFHEDTFFEVAVG